MFIKDERYIIVSKKAPFQYAADFRLEFYRIGESTEVLHDAYKFIEEQDAIDLLNQYFNEEEYEVRKLTSNYEVI